MGKDNGDAKQGLSVPIVVTAGPRLAVATDRADHYARASRAPNTWRAGHMFASKPGVN